MECAVKVKVGIYIVQDLSSHSGIVGSVSVMGCGTVCGSVPDFAECHSSVILFGHLNLHDFQVSKCVPCCFGLATCLFLSMCMHVHLFVF